jgi:hypothetical protein
LAACKASFDTNMAGDKQEIPCLFGMASSFTPTIKGFLGLVKPKDSDFKSNSAAVFPSAQSAFDSTLFCCHSKLSLGCAEVSAGVFNACFKV